MQNKFNFKNAILVLILVAAAFSRVLPHPNNFTPIAAIALFGAAYFSNRKFAFFIPIMSLFISDVVINNTVYAGYYDGFTLFYDGWYWIYGTIALTSLIGIYTLKNISIKSVVGSSVLAAIVFFLITNLACLPETTYSKDFNGLLSVYADGIPFFTPTLLGNLFYSGILFGGFELAKKRTPVLN